MKKIAMPSAFVIALVAAFAFNAPKKTVDPITANYFASGNCNNTGTTNQSNCSTSNTTSPCTINVAGNPQAFAVGGTQCSSPLFNQP